jgi:prevent-host-death family protein
LLKKQLFVRLIKNVQMQGARNPEENKTLGRSCGKFYRKNDQTFFVPLQRQRKRGIRHGGQMGVFQQPDRKTGEGELMPIIKSISSLRNRTKEITALCHEKNEPVYLTKNGEGDLVVMSIEHYERLKAKVELFEKLAIAQAQAAAGEKGLTHSQVMKKLRQRLHGE